MRTTKISSVCVITLLFLRTTLASAGEIILKDGMKMECQNETIKSGYVEFVVDDLKDYKGLGEYKINDWGRTASLYRMPLALVSSVNGVPADDLDSTSVATDLEKEWPECLSDGRLAARSTVGTTGSRLAGFFGGLILGAIGTSAVVLVQSEPDPPADLHAPNTEPICEYAFHDGYTSEGQHKKQMAALEGGIFGTTILVAAIVLVAMGD